MTKIVIEIENCSFCPHFSITNSYSTDGFDRGDDWYCKKKDQRIAGFVEWNDEIPIPEWCPIKL